MTYNRETKAEALRAMDAFIQYMEVSGSKYLIEPRVSEFDRKPPLDTHVSVIVDEPKSFLGFDYTVHKGTLYFLSSDVNATPERPVLSVSDITSTNQLEDNARIFARSLGINARIITKRQENLEFLARLHKQREAERLSRERSA